MFGIIAELENIETKIGQACSFLGNLSQEYFSATEPELIDLESGYTFITNTIDVIEDMLAGQRKILATTCNDLHNTYMELKKVVGVLESVPVKGGASNG